MKYRHYIICVLCVFFISADSAWAEDNSAVSDTAKKSTNDVKVRDTDYILGPGDQLDISVWKDEAMTRVVTVLPDGKIYFPLIGEVSAGGKTLAQLKKEMEKRISPYVPDVILHVDVRQVNSMLVYVIGRVNNPGRLVLNANISVLQALAIAGGPNPFARKSKIKIFRSEGENTKVFEFDYDDVAAGKHLEQNIILRRGDMIIVP
jgi:polysaccharide export outer membrane protein